MANFGHGLAAHTMANILKRNVIDPEETVEGMKNREDLKKELALTDAHVKDATLERLKTRIKFADKKPAGVK
jgi:hypothetical protein